MAEMDGPPCTADPEREAPREWHDDWMVHVRHSSPMSWNCALGIHLVL